MRKVENEPLKNNYGKSGNAQLIELALRKSFRDDAKSEGEPQAWSVGDAIATIPTQPHNSLKSNLLLFAFISNSLSIYQYFNEYIDMLI
jgi:hypothetical protein